MKRYWFAKKILRTETPERILTRRIMLFVLIGTLFVGISKLLYVGGVTFPNFELIIPTLVVVGSFSLPSGTSKVLRTVTRYFGLIALLSVFLIDVVIWGFHKIYVFTWTGFILCWSLGLQNKLSMFDRFQKLLWRTTLTAAVAIILFDIWTGLIGHSLVTGTSLWIAFLGQIPFTLYHLTSLIFVPPLVGMGKALAKVKIAVPVAVPVKSSLKSYQEVR